MRRVSTFRAAGLRYQRDVVSLRAKSRSLQVSTTDFDDLRALSEELASNPNTLASWCDAEEARIHSWLGSPGKNDGDELAHRHERPAGWYATELLWELEVIRHAAALPPSDFSAVMAAVRFGMLAKEAQIELGSPLVASARKLVDSAQSTNRKRKAERATDHARWQNVANNIWAKDPNLTKNAVARIVKSRLGLAESIKTIAPRLIKTD